MPYTKAENEFLQPYVNSLRRSKQVKEAGQVQQEMTGSGIPVLGSNSPYSATPTQVGTSALAETSKANNHPQAAADSLSKLIKEHFSFFAETKNNRKLVANTENAFEGFPFYDQLVRAPMLDLSLPKSSILTPSFTSRDSLFTHPNRIRQECAKLTTANDVVLAIIKHLDGTLTALLTKFTRLTEAKARSMKTKERIIACRLDLKLPQKPDVADMLLLNFIRNQIGHELDFFEELNLTKDFYIDLYLRVLRNLHSCWEINRREQELCRLQGREFQPVDQGSGIPPPSPRVV